ncbi:MAG: nucleotidyl transferase AbiEii/AbiGii toxin family protein [Ignavibacteriaceae bacterium]
MMNKEIKNIGASMRDRLLNLSKETSRDYNALLRQFFQERFLYRLSISHYRDVLILKGALLLVSHNISRYRPTRDVDFLGNTVSNKMEDCKNIISEIVKIYAKDGITFDNEKIKAEFITEETDYNGIRISVPYKMDTIIGNLSIDIGYGDKIVDGPVELDYPSLIGLPSPKLMVYSLESSIAEKFEAIVKLNFQTSRMKDFYDIVFIGGSKSFKSETLKEAFETTFNTRETDLRERKIIYEEEFKNDKTKQVQWNSFITKNKLDADNEFKQVVEKLENFIEPIFVNEKEKKWNPSKWRWE